MIKLVAIDLDGTFLSSKRQHISENLSAVQEVVKAGVKVVICTGRTLPGVRQYLEDFPLSSEDFMILQNGAVTHQMPQMSIVNARYQSASIRKALIECFFKTRPDGIQLVGFDQEHLYLIEDGTPIKEVQEDSKTLETPITFISKEDFLSLDDIFKMMVLGPKDALDDWQNQISEQVTSDFAVVRSQPVIIEFLLKGVNKATALQQLAGTLGIKQEEVMAIGDEQNDIEMLDWVGLSVAMGNASDEIKAHAKHVTDINDQAGVAKALHKFIFN